MCRRSAVGQVVAAVRPARPAGHGASWEALVPVTAEVTGWVKDGLTLVKIGELVERRGIAVPYRTLARFAAAECGYSLSRQQVTVPVADGKPGEEVQIDFGYLGMIGDGDRRRKLHALVFTAVLSRYCFVFLTFSQTTAAVIAGCEAAWGFFGGTFKVLIVDNLKPVVDKAERLEPRWNREWLEYAQARGLVVDPGRVRSPQDKPRVAYCTSSGLSAWLLCSCWLGGSWRAAGLRAVDGVCGAGRVVEDFAFIVIALSGDNSGVVPGLDGGSGHAERGGRLDLPRAFRTAYLWLIHAADCRSRYSSRTCRGVRY